VLVKGINLISPPENHTDTNNSSNNMDSSQYHNGRQQQGTSHLPCIVKRIFYQITVTNVYNRSFIAIHWLLWRC